MLIVFAGLPGTGKTTVARGLASRHPCVYLRIDEIEQAIAHAGLAPDGVGIAGYLVANALAASNLSLGGEVVVDCVNPVDASRKGWREVAAHAGVPILEIEIVCSDPAEHRRRVEGRASDIPGHAPPDWAAVQAHEYEPWTTQRLVLDTALLSPEAAVTLIADAAGRIRGAGGRGDDAAPSR